MISEKTIMEAAKRLVDNFHPERIILFGSYARGTADEHSDVDFLVITQGEKGQPAQDDGGDGRGAPGSLNRDGYCRYHP
jgi:predicted nucleotidyltransferase